MARRGRAVNERRWSSWTAIPKGVITTIALFAPIVLGILALERTLIAEATRHDRALAVMLWVTGSSIVALAVGGWVVGRSSTPRSTVGALRSGFLSGAATLALLVGITYAVLGETMDFHSVGVALGMTEIPRSDLSRPVPPAALAGRSYESNPPDLAHERTLRTIAFVLVWAVLALIAAALGALASASHRRPVAAQGDRRNCHWERESLNAVT